MEVNKNSVVDYDAELVIWSNKLLFVEITQQQLLFLSRYSTLLVVRDSPLSQKTKKKNKKNWREHKSKSNLTFDTSSIYCSNVKVRDADMPGCRIICA